MQATQGRGLSHEEFARAAESTGANVSWTALLASAVGPGSHLKDVEKAHELAARGVPVFPQVAVQPVQFEMSWKAPFIYEGMRLFEPVAKSDHEGRKAFTQMPTGEKSLRRRLAMAARLVIGGHEPK